MRTASLGWWRCTTWSAWWVGCGSWVCQRSNTSAQTFHSERYPGHDYCFANPLPGPVPVPVPKSKFEIGRRGRVRGSGFRVQSSEFRVQSSEFLPCPWRLGRPCCTHSPTEAPAPVLLPAPAAQTHPAPTRPRTRTHARLCAPKQDITTAIGSAASQAPPPPPPPPREREKECPTAPR